MRDISDYLHNPQVLQAVKKMFESNEALSKEVETMRREQVAQWADKIIASTPERRGVQLIATQTDRTPEFVKDLAYCLRARAPKLVLVQGSVNDGKPMLTVMLGEEITAQGVNAGAVVREAAKLMQGGGGGQAFFATAGGKNPDFIFLDEATNALDANNEREIMEQLHAFYKGRTVVVVAHRLSTVRDADKIVVLDKGRVVEEGTHQELTALRGTYYKLVKNQLELGN